MGISTNSHGKRSDKETQSPLLKVFKEIMMREENDPEKRNLLLDQEKKRKQYSGSRMKANRRSCESSSSEHRKRSPYKALATEQRQAEISQEAQNAFRADKRGRWWKKISSINMANETCRTEGPCVLPTTGKKEDDTCSCVSCALRRIVGSEYTCIACLLLLFTISIMAAFCLVYKNVPSATATTHKPPRPKIVPVAKKGPAEAEIGDSERLKRRIDIINENLIKNELREAGDFEQPHYDDRRSDPIDLPGTSGGASGMDFGPSFRGLNTLEVAKTKAHEDSDLPSIVDPVILNDQSSDKLKEFYKKLVQTDEMIKTLKNIKFHNQNNVYNDNYESKPPDRFKRSLKVFTYPKIHQVTRRRRDIYNRVNDISKRGIYNRYDINPAGKKNKILLKEFSNESMGDPTAFVIEKKKLIVQYKPLSFRKVVPKCSHVPKEKHIHHEHQMKHPFYQNTQRLDELLDRFLNKNLPDIVSDPFGFDSLFQPERNKCKHITTTKRFDVVNINRKGDEACLKEKKMTTKTAKSKIVNNQVLTDTLRYKQITPSSTISTHHKPRVRTKEEKITKITTTIEDLISGKKTFFTFSTPDILKLLDHESSTPYERKFYQHEADMIKKEEATLITASPNEFELLLSVSTLMNPQVVEETVSVTSTEVPLINRVPNLRRLMQMDGEEEENLGYEDFKEVLTDNMENQDDNEGRGERKRRNDDTVDEIIAEIPFTKLGIMISEPVTEKDAASENTIAGGWSGAIEDTSPLALVKENRKENKYNSPSNSVNNPNWKGPMPLYPDELSSMLKDKSIEKVNMLSTENQRMETKPPASAIKRKRSDIEYVEDYLDDKYDKLVEMAQAYSDYGVLEDKKENVRNDKHPATNSIILGDRVKLSADEEYNERDLMSLQKETDSIYYPFFIQSKEKTSSTSDNSLFKIVDATPAAPKPVSRSEGFRVEVRPSQDTRHNNLVTRLLQSHIKLDIAGKKIEDSTKSIYTPVSVFSKPQLLYSNPKSRINSIEEALNKKMASRDELPELPNKYFNFNKKRVLLSTLFKESDENSLEEDSSDDQNNNIIQFDELLSFNDPKLVVKKRDGELLKPSNLRKLIRERNSFLRNIVSKYIGNENYTNHDMIIMKSDGVESTTKQNAELDHLLELTRNNIILFSSPYLNTQPLEQFTASSLISTTEPNIVTYESNVNIPSGLEQVYQIPNHLMNFNLNAETIKPITVNINEENLERQPYTTSKQPDLTIENLEIKIEPPFPYNFSGITYDNIKIEDESTTPKLFEEASNIANAFREVKRVRRFKRNIGTVKTTLEKSNVTIHESPLGSSEVHKNESINESEFTGNFSAKTTAGKTPKNMTVSDFFMMISDWFRALEGVPLNDKPKNYSGCDIPELLQQFNKKRDESRIRNRNTTEDSLYPFYDSEIIDNIGHRSRVLFSIQEENTTESARRIDVDNYEVIREKSANVSGMENNTLFDSNNSTHLIDVNNATSEKYQGAIIETFVKKNITSNKVKRNADDINLISWNDMYDDEYGIRTDNFNNVVRDKYLKERDFIKRSGRWVQDKIKKFAANLKGHDSEDAVKRRTSRTVENIGIVKKLKDLYRKSKRQSYEEEYDSNQKAIFDSLEANMIEVCKKAAKAVKQTRNADVKEESSEGTLAASLMQQLVRLLTDLVDYQVEQKTCCQLPADLKVFLEWLTKPEDEMKETELGTASYARENPDSFLFRTTTLYSDVNGPDELITEPPSENTETTESALFTETDFRTQYLESLRSVQELMNQYDDMTDEDKSKMTGVKVYLQNQLRYLNDQLNGYDFYNLYEKSSIPLRYKRGYPGNFKHRHKRKHYKFVRNFGKKHTRTTANYYDGIPVSEKKKDSCVEKGRNRKNIKLTAPQRNERNLKDVYYKAVAEAKKYSTSLAKNGHKRYQEIDRTFTTQL